MGINPSLERFQAHPIWEMSVYSCPIHAIDSYNHLNVHDTLLGKLGFLTPDIHDIQGGYPALQSVLNS